MKRNVFIIGGGISGLTAAYFFAQSGKYEVHVIEKNGKLGGLLQSFDYGKYGYFDCGAHNILETDIKEIDELFLSLLPQDEWQITTTINGQRRALTGLIYNERFQKNSPFIDLRADKDIDKYISDFFLNLQKSAEIKDFNILDSTAEEYSLYLFGELITNNIITPVLDKLYGLHPSKLNALVMHLTQLSRIGLFEESIMKELVDTDEISKRLSYPEQRDLPEKHLTHLKAYYPKKYGMYRVINSLEKKLLDLDVKFYKNSVIEKISVENSIIDTLELNGVEYEVGHIVNSVGLFPISQLLNIDTSVFEYDPYPKTVITNILIDKALDCGEISFIYSYAKGAKIFRIDNYINYSSGSKRDALYPISVESLSFGEIEEKILEEKIIDELKEYNIIQQDTKINFIKTEILDSGFPLLSQNNISILNSLRDKVEFLNISNLTNIGILSSKGLFFENDVIKDTYTKIQRIIDGE